MADNGVGPTGGTGTLFGAKDLQHSLDALSHQITTLNSLLSKAHGPVSSSTSSAGGSAPTPGNTGVPSAGPVASKWNQFSNWVSGQAGGKGNGGNGSFGGISINPAGASGGGAGGGGLGSAFQGAMSLWRVGSSYGASQMQSQVSMDTFASWSANGMNGGATDANKAAILRQTFGGGGRGYNSIGLSQTDIMQGEMMRQRIAGTPYLNSQRGMTTWSGMNQLGITNPTLGAVGSASVMQNLYSMQSYYASRAIGMPTALGAGGRMTNPSQLANQIMQSTFQGRSHVSANVLNAGLGQGGALINNMQAAGYSPDTVNAMSDLIRAQNTAMNKGMSLQEFQTLVDQASHGTEKQMQAAQKKLSQAGGLSYTSLQALKNGQAPGNARSADINGDFSKSVAGAANQLAKFSTLLEKIVNQPWAKKMIGSTGGMAMVNSAISNFTTALGTGNPMGMLGILGGSTSGGSQPKMSASANLGPGDGANSNKNTKHAASLHPGVTAAQVIATAETQIGVPYHLGMETPGKGFDCGSLLQWAYGQHGIRIERYVPYLWNQTKGNAVDVSKTQPGDLLFRKDNGHVTMKISDKQIIEAPHTGAFVRIRSFNSGEWDHASRVVGAVGQLGAVPADSGTNQQAMSQKGNVGSNDLGAGGGYGSTEEVDAIQAGLSNLSASPVGATQPSSNNGSSGSNNTNGGATPVANKGSVKSIFQKTAAQFGWGAGAEWTALDKVEMSEAGYNPLATNPGSKAFGLAQALGHGNSRTRGKYSNMYGGGGLTDAQAKLANSGDAAMQSLWMMNYIKGRYGDPIKTWQFHVAHNWYDKGAWKIEKDETARVHRDEMIIPAKQAETIRQALTTDAYFKKSMPGNAPTGGSAGNGGVVLHFNQGSIVIQMHGPVSDITARSAARSFVDELGKKNIYDQIAAGVTNVSS